MPPVVNNGDLFGRERRVGDQNTLRFLLSVIHARRAIPAQLIVQQIGTHFRADPHERAGVKCEEYTAKYNEPIKNAPIAALNSINMCGPLLRLQRRYLRITKAVKRPASIVCGPETMT